MNLGLWKDIYYVVPLAKEGARGGTGEGGIDGL